MKEKEKWFENSSERESVEEGLLEKGITVENIQRLSLQESELEVQQVRKDQNELISTIEEKRKLKQQLLQERNHRYFLLKPGNFLFTTIDVKKYVDVYVTTH